MTKVVGALDMTALAQIPIAEVRTFLSRDVMVTRTRLELTAITHSSGLHIVAQGWNRLPDQSSIVQDTLTVLAHSRSPGEQRLADRLSRDDELASLFLCNPSVRTVRGSLYLVDLLWLAGKVIVEIDGYKHHSSFEAFSDDRNRDYELLISGYVVLRLPHDEVIGDIEIAIEKIRDVVRFRRNQMNQGEV
jgi:very-short-patch-repair endonuclease